MAFWGVEVKPGKPYIHRYDTELGRLHVSQATLGDGTSTKKSILQCRVGDKSPINLCSLLPEKLETSQLNLEFEEEDEVIFSVTGSTSVHLSGFYYGDNEDDHGDQCGLDPYDDVVGSESESDDSLDYDSDDDDEDDLMDDDLDMYPASHVAKSGVTIEEIIDDEKPANVKDSTKRQKKLKSLLTQSDDNDNADRQIVLRNDTAHAGSESEDEDGFPTLSNREKEGTKEGRTNEEVPKNKTKSSLETQNNLKRKSEVVEDGEPSRKSDQVNDVVPENDKKQKKKNKKKKTTKEEAVANDTNGKVDDMNMAPVSGMASGQTPTNDKETQKKKKKNKNQENAPDAKIASKEKSTATKKEPLQVRSFPNGMVVEELTMGNPHGKKAASGKKVKVRYIGKLQKNGTIFDSNIGRAPFEFRLGVGHVIKGWDVGVNGMRVGDKRRLTIPPSMGYGSKGAGGKIPPNSWLVFDVELVDVK